MITTSVGVGVGAGDRAVARRQQRRASGKMRQMRLMKTRGRPALFASNNPVKID
jgi:hypothetical protein